jgi:hypothetical protein
MNIQSVFFSLSLDEVFQESCFDNTTLYQNEL